VIALVVGMHRSGTSSVAGLLHANGFTMGEEEVLRPFPNPENPRGFFENHRFRALNDRILARRGYRVESFDPAIPACAPRPLARHRMRRLLARYARSHSDWGFKDPRTCLTLGGWLREIEGFGWLPQTRVVFVTRDPRAVARSLAVRNGLTLETALQLWRVYNERALAALDAFAPTTHYVEYEQLCARKDATAAALFAFLGRTGAAIETEFVSPDLERNAAPTDSAAESVLDAALSGTRDLLCRRAEASRRGIRQGGAP
jgi:hypothetical protein